MKTKPIESTIQVNNQEITYCRVSNDANGNPRYVVHFLALNIEPKDYGKIPDLKKYRAKWYGGGYVFQSYNLKEDLQFALDQVNDYYKKGEK